MIKANELRIGNYIYHLGTDYDQGENKVHDPEGDEAAEVLAIRLKIKGEYELLIDAHSADGNRRSATMVSAEGIGPIPLTPEWLERLGFERKYEDVSGEPLTYGILKLDVNVAYVDDGWYLRTECADDYYDRCIGERIESVHRLQNIYLDLTGEELNVKL